MSTMNELHEGKKQKKKIFEKKSPEEDSLDNFANNSLDCSLEIQENVENKPQVKRGMKKPLGKRLRAHNNLRKIL